MKQISDHVEVYPDRVKGDNQLVTVVQVINAGMWRSPCVTIVFLENVLPLQQEIYSREKIVLHNSFRKLFQQKQIVCSKSCWDKPD